LEGLRSVGLIETVKPTDDEQRRPAVVHPLVAETIRQQAGDALEASTSIAVELISAAVGHLGYENPRDTHLWRALLPHLNALLSSNVTLTDDDQSNLAQATIDMCAALVFAGEWGSTRAVAESGLRRLTGLPTDDDGVLGLRRYQADAWHLLGRYAEAEALYRQTLDVLLRVKGPEHEDTLTIQHQLAGALASRGKTAEAEALYRHVLDKTQKGPEHRDTLTSRKRLASVLFPH